MSDAPKKTALVILADGVEEVEAVTPIDLLRRAGLEVTVAALGPTLQVVGRSSITLAADVLFSELGNRTFDVLVLPGGPGVKNLRADARVVAAAKAQGDAGRLVAAICAAPTVLKDAGVLPGRRHTAHFSVENELPQLVKTEAVIRDGNVVTSRGAGTAIPFALEIIRALISDDAAAKVAAAICYPN